jgi:KipI family sensor histidine kinase inhibitor
VEYGDAIDPEINRKVRAMAMSMEQERTSGVVEFIPTYRSLIIMYDPSITDLPQLKESLRVLERRIGDIEIPPPETYEIPVCYGGELGPDIEYVADRHGLTVDEVIQMHSAPEYQIYMIGFTPGFPFLGGLPEQLHTPRLETPRTLVPGGSVGIANQQTGIYPIDSPGGWRLIGRTPQKLFDPDRDNPFLLKAGGLLKFSPISLDEYRRMTEGGG